MGKSEEYEGAVIPIKPRHGVPINPLTTGPMIALLPEKIQDAYAILDGVRQSLSETLPELAAPFSESERAAFALAITQSYHRSMFQPNSSGPSLRNVYQELLESAPEQERLLLLFQYLTE